MPGHFTPQFKAFTKRYSGLANRITVPIHIWPAFDPAMLPSVPDGACVTEALWDTGATHSVIRADTATQLSLPVIGTTHVNHAGGSSDVNAYVVTIGLPNHVLVAGLRVAECHETVGDFGAIIGMDIISRGDLSITNLQGETCLTFRIPSLAKVDYVAEWNNALYAGVGRNDPCPCGSGKKYKDCHWKSRHL